MRGKPDGLAAKAGTIPRGMIGGASRLQVRAKLRECRPHTGARRFTRARSPDHFPRCLDAQSETGNPAACSHGDRFAAEGSHGTWRMYPFSRCRETLVLGQ